MFLRLTDLPLTSVVDGLIRRERHFATKLWRIDFGWSLVFDFVRPWLQILKFGDLSSCKSSAVTENRSAPQNIACSSSNVFGNYLPILSNV